VVFLQINFAHIFSTNKYQISNREKYLWFSAALGQRMNKICEEWPQVTAIKNFQEGAKFSPDRGFSVSPIRR
jgi:hypothetical protein